MPEITPPVARLALLAAVGLALVVGVSACSSPGYESSYSSESDDSSSDSDDSDSESEDSPTPGILSCSDLAGIAQPLVQNLYLILDSNSSDETLCLWSTTADATITDGSDLDLLINIRYWENQDASDAALYCESARTTASGLDAMSGCAIDSIEDPAGNGLQATIPYFDIRIDYSCDGSVNCSPAVPVTQEQGLAVLASISSGLLGG